MPSDKQSQAGCGLRDKDQSSSDLADGFSGHGKERSIAYAPYLAEAQKLIREKDAPILAALMLEDITYLVTRDKRDFLEN